jgi:hypothetical protein
MRLRNIVVALALVAAGSVAVQVRPAAAITVTPEVVARIRAHCVENQAALNRLHQTDAFLRNDRGDLYRTISDKLMVPLNRRLASNQLDGGSLITIAAQYSSEYDTFYNVYVDYDNALTKLLRINCDQEPVAFYNALLDARSKREAVSKSNQAIKEYVRQYGVSFSDFKSNFEKANP